VVVWVRELVSLEEDALGDSRVLHSGFDDVDGIVVQVVVGDTFSNSVVFVGVLNDGLLEVSIEAKNLK